MSVLKKIRDRERQLPSPENRVSENTISTIAENPPLAGPRELALPLPPAHLPPARHCLAPDCPCPIVTWITVYDRDSPAPEFRCYGCSPPPSWSFVGARWLLAFPDDRWTWEPFPRFDTRHDRHGQHTNPDSLAVIGGGGDGGTSWHDREPSSITAADRSRITIFEPIGWNDLLRLTVKHGFEEAWRLLQVRTDLKLPRPFTPHVLR